MPSKTLHNIFSSLENVKNLDKCYSNTYDTDYRSLIDFISHYEIMDFTLDAIYGHDTESQNIFDFVVRYRTVRVFFDWNNIPFAIENAPYTKEQWAELENKANLMPSYRYAQGDIISDRIDTWLLES
jgi:hypothetical protein